MIGWQSWPLQDARLVRAGRGGPAVSFLVRGTKIFLFCRPLGTVSVVRSRQEKGGRKVVGVSAFLPGTGGAGSFLFCLAACER